MSQFEERVAGLLADARVARETGDRAALLALTNAVLALDPGNAEAEALLVGSARRRQMTLLFCDIVGSTALADGRDPEDMHRILRSYRALCGEVLARHGGVVHDHQGDGMLALFGYPDVREDDVQRAVHCALALVSTIRARSEVHVRVAVHTDLVVIDRTGISGATSNEASRIHQLADPDTVLISDTTESLVRGWFDTSPRGQVTLRGVSRPLELHLVHGARAARRRAGLSPFVGRRAEVHRMRSAWRATVQDAQTAATGRPVPTRPGLLVTGPPGIGKTRLLTEAARDVDGVRIEGLCSRYQSNTALFPFRSGLERACGIGPEDDGGTRLRKLRTRLAESEGPPGDLPFLAAVLQIPRAALVPPPDVDPQGLRDTALQVAARLLLRSAAGGPALLLVDDLQWADQSTLDLILMLLSAPRPGVLILLAARSDFAPSWPAAVHTRLQLDRLTEPELAELADGLLTGSVVSADTRAELISRSDGMPLFLVELARTADDLNRGQVIHRSIRMSEHHIPAALWDPLLARLPAAGIDLDLVQLAATIGREVDGTLLRRAAELPEPRLRAGLTALAAADLIEPVEGDSIRFRHELIREVAYETQPRAMQRERHSRIADHLLADIADTEHVDADPLGLHLERAQRFAEAIEVAVRAAQADQAIGAHAEATRRLTGALALIDRLEPGPDRDRTEVGLRTLRGFSAVMSTGYGAPEAAEDHPRCIELFERAGSPTEQVHGLNNSFSYFLFRGDLREAAQVNARIATIDPAAAVVAVHDGWLAFFAGRFAEARRLLEAFEKHPWGHSPGRPPEGWQLPNDPLTASRSMLVTTLWVLGDLDAAIELGERTLARARSLRFPYGPFSVCFAHSMIAMTLRMAGDDAGVGRHTAEVARLAEQHKFSLFRLTGATHQALTAAHAGEPDAVQQVIQNVWVWRMVLVADLWSPFWLTELARVQAKAGDPTAAFASLQQAVEIAAATGNSSYAAETLRLRGELRCAVGDPAGFTDLEQAVDTARQQGATVFVERTESSLRRMAVR